MRNKKKRRILLLVLLLLAVTVGFAALATTLRINGSTNITKQTWDIYWDNASIVPTTNLANENITTGAQTKTNDSTTLEWAVNLNIPGDYYEFTVDAVNNGTIDAMITGIDSKIGNESIISTVNGQLVVDTSVIPSYLNYTITYSDGTPLGLNHLLAKKTNNTPTKEKYKVRVEYNKDLDNDDLDEVTSPTEEVTFTFSVKYGQADNTAVPSHTTWTLPQGKTANTLALGDEICLGTECFNFVKYDGNDIVMLAKYNLKVGNMIDNYDVVETYTSSDTGYNKQSSDVRGYVDGEEAWSGTIQFSGTYYWDDAETYPIDVYDAENYNEDPQYDEYGASTNPDYSISYFVEGYKDILEDAGAIIKEARLLTYSEATAANMCDGANFECPTSGTGSFITNTSFWLGSADTQYDVWYILSDGSLGSESFDYNVFFGVRPVVVVEKSNL